MEEKAGRHAVEVDNDPMVKTAVRFCFKSVASFILLTNVSVMKQDTMTLLLLVLSATDICIPQVECWSDRDRDPLGNLSDLLAHPFKGMGSGNG